MGLLEENVDLKTIILLNFIGAMSALIMMFTYNKNTINRQTMYLHTVALAALAGAFGVYYIGWCYISKLPFWFDTAIGNALIVLSSVSEYLAIQTYLSKKSIRWLVSHFIPTVMLILLSIYLAIADGVDMLRIVMVTFVVAGIWMLSGMTLLRPKKKSILQRTIGWMFVIISCVMMYRIFEAIMVGTKYTILGGQIGHAIAFMTHFVYLMVSGLGMILLVKEKSDMKLLHSTRTDSLTGVLNREYFYEIAESKLVNATKKNRSLGIVMMDLDAFKGINDRYGHIIGDEVLKCYANAINDAKEDDVVVGRYGGDEFLLIVENRSYEQTLALLDKMSGFINKQVYKEINIHSSFGLCFYAAVTEVLPTIDTLIHHADMSLYESKRKGGKCISAMQYQC